MGCAMACFSRALFSNRVSAGAGATCRMRSKKSSVLLMRTDRELDYVVRAGKGRVLSPGPRLPESKGEVRLVIFVQSSDRLV